MRTALAAGATMRGMTAAQRSLRERLRLARLDVRVALGQLGCDSEARARLREAQAELERLEHELGVRLETAKAKMAVDPEVAMLAGIHRVEHMLSMGAQLAFALRSVSKQLGLDPAELAI